MPPGKRAGISTSSWGAPGSCLPWLVAGAGTRGGTAGLLTRRCRGGDMPRSRGRRSLITCGFRSGRIPWSSTTARILWAPRASCWHAGWWWERCLRRLCSPCGEGRRCGFLGGLVFRDPGPEFERDLGGHGTCHEAPDVPVAGRGVRADCRRAPQAARSEGIRRLDRAHGRAGPAHHPSQRGLPERRTALASDRPSGPGQLGGAQRYQRRSFSLPGARRPRYRSSTRP